MQHSRRVQKNKNKCTEVGKKSSFASPVSFPQPMSAQINANKDPFNVQFLPLGKKKPGVNATSGTVQENCSYRASFSIGRVPQGS